MRKVLALMLVLATGSRAQDEAQTNRLIVHEWGTFTAVYGADGTMLEWRPLDEVSDLPRFVYDRATIPVDAVPRVRESKKIVETYQRMETPVLYFYSDREMIVDVSVGFPRGLITEWYPRVREFGPPLGDGRKPLAISNGYLRWGKIKVIPPGQLKVELPAEKSPSHYYPARETDSAYVRVCGTGEEYQKTEYEKFLFYRGVGNFGLPLQVKAKGNGAFAVTNPTKAPIGHIFVITVKKDGKGKYAFFEQVKPGQTREVTLDVSENCLSKEQLIRRIGEELEECLVMEGLFRKEAKAMLKTWTDSYFEQEGTRVLYLLPEATTNEILPLTVSPKPVETKRVMVARVEILTPERTQVLNDLIAQLGAESIEARDRAERQILAYGRFAEPMLKEAARTTSDPEIRTRAEALVAKHKVNR
jgi:hypothetical protein